MIHRVLLIEDEAPDGSQIVHDLAAHDMAITWVKNGESALEILDKETFDAVLIDVSLPGINGLEITKHIRKTESLKSMPIVILTKTKTKLIEMASYQAGGNYFVTKPLDMDEMDKAIRHMHLMGSVCQI